MKTADRNLTRWLDNEGGSPPPAHDSARAEDARHARALRELLRHHATPRLPNADFFQSQVMDRIAATQPSPQRATPRLPWLPWLPIAGTASLAATALLYFTAIPPGPYTAQPPSPYHAEIIAAKTSKPTIAATVVRNRDGNNTDATALFLDGLPVIPANERVR